MAGNLAILFTYVSQSCGIDLTLSRYIVHLFGTNTWKIPFNFQFVLCRRHEGLREFKVVTCSLQLVALCEGAIPNVLSFLKQINTDLGI